MVLCGTSCRASTTLGLPLQAAWEAEELRSRSLGLEERARRAEGQTEAERARRLETERALQASREREAALQVRVTPWQSTSISDTCSTLECCC